MYIKSARFYTDKIKKSFLERRWCKPNAPPKRDCFSEGYFFISPAAAKCSQFTVHSLFFEGVPRSSLCFPVNDLKK